jgi:outer membrane receptor protein involved in Fe transport
VQYLYRGGVQARVFNESYDKVEAYDQVNLMLHYQPDHRPFDITLRVTNLLNDAGPIRATPIPMAAARPSPPIFRRASSSAPLVSVLVLPEWPS